MFTKRASVKDLIEVLEVSVEKHGSTTPLTLGHLLNICKMADRERLKKEEAHEEFMEDLYNRALTEDW